MLLKQTEAQNHFHETDIWKQLSYSPWACFPVYISKIPPIISHIKWFLVFSSLQLFTTEWVPLSNFFQSIGTRVLVPGVLSSTHCRKKNNHLSLSEYYSPKNAGQSWGQTHSPCFLIHAAGRPSLPHSVPCIWFSTPQNWPSAHPY